MLDGCIDMDLTFDNETMCTPVYIKADDDVQDQLLLSEGVYSSIIQLSSHGEEVESGITSSQVQGSRDRQPDQRLKPCPLCSSDVSGSCSFCGMCWAFTVS